MTSFVLVHGAWHGGWCWSRVARLLRQGGHEVHAPTLTGVGERVHLLHRGVTLDTHVEDIVRVFEAEELSDTVLCGHSYGGMVITGVADRIPDRIRSLVYLDAFVPADGQCTLDFQPPDRAAFFRAEAAGKGGGWLIPPVPAARFKVNEADQAWVDRRCVPHPLACFEQKLRLTGAFARVARRSYIKAGAYVPSPFDAIFERLKGDPGWTVHSVPCGHDVMVDRPEELAQLLVQCA
ncbi:MAG TPA: alpha/beta hydrolase [Alphaproteobacteria bacterium]|nr:alpha/beta hydrolase [Alphaproteobacteria bacterium]